MLGAFSLHGACCQSTVDSTQEPVDIFSCLLLFCSNEQKPSDILVLAAHGYLFHLWGNIPDLDFCNQKIITFIFSLQRKKLHLEMTKIIIQEKIFEYEFM